MANTSRRFPTTSRTSGQSEAARATTTRQGLHAQELAVAEEAARAIYHGKPRYAAERIRQMQDPAVVVLAASLALGVLLGNQAGALKRIREVMETYR